MCQGNCCVTMWQVPMINMLKMTDFWWLGDDIGEWHYDSSSVQNCSNLQINFLHWICGSFSMSPAHPTTPLHPLKNINTRMAPCGRWHHEWEQFSVCGSTIQSLIFNISRILLRLSRSAWWNWFGVVVSSCVPTLAVSIHPYFDIFNPTHFC